jgi:signal transduction histidine kinase
MFWISLRLIVSQRYVLEVLVVVSISNSQKDEPAISEQDNEPILGTKMQSLSGRTDIAELFEEVIEGSVAGKAHIVQDTAALNSRPSSMHTSTDDLAERLQHHGLQSGASKDTYPGVAVLLDIDYQKDWTFTTQPGALRRILMNILGNALKYTESGYVKVGLALKEPETNENADTHSTMFLSVADTGKGISKSFLRTRLFRPFNQEDHLSTGCGLGLSIVRSLVVSLKGTLEIQSEQGVSSSRSFAFPSLTYCRSGPRSAFNFLLFVPSTGLSEVHPYKFRIMFVRYHYHPLSCHRPWVCYDPANAIPPIQVF